MSWTSRCYRWHHEPSTRCGRAAGATSNAVSCSHHHTTTHPTAHSPVCTQPHCRGLSSVIEPADGLDDFVIGLDWLHAGYSMLAMRSDDSSTATTTTTAPLAPPTNKRTLDPSLPAPPPLPPPPGHPQRAKATCARRDFRRGFSTRSADRVLISQRLSRGMVPSPRAPTDAVSTRRWWAVRPQTPQVVFLRKIVCGFTPRDKEHVFRQNIS